MNIYKVIFAKNEVISCHQLDDRVSLKSEYYYEHDKGKIIYALIKAIDEDDAIGKSDAIVKEVRSKVFGNDFIN